MGVSATNHTWSTRMAAAVRRIAPTLNGVWPAGRGPGRAGRSVRRRQSRCRRLRSVEPSCFMGPLLRRRDRRGDRWRRRPRAGGSRPGCRVRWVDQPCSSSQRASESAPRCFCTTRTARAGGGVEPAEPAAQQLVQRGLADADRRVRPDGGEAHLGGHLVGVAPSRPGRRTPAASALRGTAPTRPLVHVDRPHRGVGRPPGQGDGDRPVAAAEVEHVDRAARQRRARRAAGAWCRRRRRSPENTPRSVVSVRLTSGSTRGTVARRRRHGRLSPRSSAGPRARARAGSDTGRTVVAGRGRAASGSAAAPRSHVVRRGPSGRISVYGPVHDPHVRRPRAEASGRPRSPTSTASSSPGRRHARHDVRRARRSAWPPPRSACRSGSSSTTCGDEPRSASSTRGSSRAAASGSTTRAASRSPASRSRSCGRRRSSSSGYDLDGNELSDRGRRARGPLFQHELDHLDGVLLFERLDDDQRKAALKAIRQMTLVAPARRPGSRAPPVCRCASGGSPRFPPGSPSASSSSARRRRRCRPCAPWSPPASTSPSSSPGPTSAAVAGATSAPAR